MKRLFLSLSLLFAFTLATQAQFGPGEDGLPGLPGPCADLVITAYDIPSSAPASGTIPVTLTIRNAGDCATSANNASVNIMEASGIGGPYHPSFVAVPALSPNQSTNVTVQITPYIPVAGTTFLVTWMMVDHNLQIAETNENNNFISSFPAFSNVVTLF